MIMFSEGDIARIRKRAQKNPRYLDQILKSTEEVRQALYIQKSGLANWGHYYVCPVCTKALEFNYWDKEHHKCPTCGRVYTGEPYCGVWWRIVLGKNADACFKMAVAYLATGEDAYLQFSLKILCEYADNYENYEVHGDIPYNHPGRLAAQVLDDSMIINDMARAYIMIKDNVSPEDRRHIEEGLLRPAAQHILSQMIPQIHNHEVCSASTVGIVGIAIGDSELCDIALNGKYGLKYQLDHAVLDDGLWFECSLGYHMFALRWFMYYDMAARYTEYGLLKNEHYASVIVKMFEMLGRLREKNDHLPELNDGGTGYDKSLRVFEYAYSALGVPIIGDGLARSVKKSGRLDDLGAPITGDGLASSAKKSERLDEYSLLYGVDEVPSCEEALPGNYFSEGGSCIAVINDEKRGHSLLLKATPYGGEHDHYDRMSLSFSPFGKRVCADMGTASGYGAPLHYSYFKNTATHNTVAINGDNMPPVNSDIVEYREDSEDDITLKVKTEWREGFVMPDSFTIKQWVDESYENVKMIRTVRWLGDYFIDVFRVESDNTLNKDWVWHIDGELKNLPRDAAYLGSPWSKDPQSKLHDAYEAVGAGTDKYSYDCKDFDLDIYAYSDGKRVIFAKGPNNPSTTDISYILESTCEKCVTFVNVIEAHRNEAKIDTVSVVCSNRTADVTVRETSGAVKSFSFEF